MTARCARYLSRSVIAATLVVASAASSVAQTVNASPAAARPIQEISINPITTTFGWYNGEYQRSIDATKTWGVSGTFLGAGPDIGYSWLLGAKQNVGIAMGIGAMRLFGGDLDGVSFTIPTVRLIDVGIAF